MLYITYLYLCFTPKMYLLAYLCTYPLSFIFSNREERDLKVALELAEQLAKRKQTHDVEIKTNSAVFRPGILKKQHQESARR